MLAAQRGQEVASCAPWPANPQNTAAVWPVRPSADRRPRRPTSRSRGGAGEVVLPDARRVLPTDRVVRPWANRPPIGAPLPRLLGHRVATLQHVPGQLAVDGMGTMMLRRRNPTAFSTLPFSLPEFGLQNPVSSRNDEQFDRDPTRSDGRRRYQGTAPMCSRSPAHTHSSPGQGHAVAHVPFRERFDPVPGHDGIAQIEYPSDGRRCCATVSRLHRRHICPSHESVVHALAVCRLRGMNRSACSHPPSP